MSLSNRHAMWLEERKLLAEKAAEVGVYSEGPRIAFPYIKLDKIVYAKCRLPEDKSSTIIKPTGQKQDFLWLEHILPAEPKTTPLVITEGELDALAVRQVGFQCVVSLPSGAAKDLAGALNKVDRCIATEIDGHQVLKPSLTPFIKFVIATDGDDPGMCMRDALIERLGTDRCWVIKYPAGCKDPNDILLNHGPELLFDVIDNAEPMERGGFVPFTQNIEPMPKVYSTGYPFLDRLIKPAVPSPFYSSQIVENRLD